MTTWQWRVIMALVRYVLRHEGIDIPSIHDSETVQGDHAILVEAVIRDSK
jgi:hypothetical protein